MSVYFVTGSLGAGKGLAAINQIKNYASNGLKIAGNIDVYLDKLATHPNSKLTYIRIPDKPVFADFLALGSGNDTYDSENNSLLVLDETVTWLNARTWNDKERAPIIDWLIHSRKHGWDVLILAQSFETLDKQIVSTVMEYHVSMNNLEKINVPFVGSLLKNFTKRNRPVKLPKYHIGKVMYKNLVWADTWKFFGKDLYTFYDTKQVFTENYPHGPHSQLSRWHLEGRYLLSPVKKSIILYLFRLTVYISHLITFTKPLKTPSKHSIPILKSQSLPAISKQKNNTFKPPLRTVPTSFVVDGFRVFSL
jgi:Zonular occludens toxin (Zot)